ncbi:MAG: hypothetical protein ACM3OC_03150 [Deltaproteobacteria bacterium]
MNGSLTYFLLLSSAFHAAGFAFVGLSFRSPHIEQPPLVLAGRLLPGKPAEQGPAALRRRVFPQTCAPVQFPKTAVFNPGKGDLRKPAVYAALPGCARPQPQFAAAPAVFAVKKDSVITIHPLLPYGLQLYFRDRQSAHLELMFMIYTNRPEKKFIIIKRKVSSGNLDADLLCSRYLGHYLFIQQERFATNTWQTVRIDLSQ